MDKGKIQKKLKNVQSLDFGGRVADSRAGVWLYAEDIDIPKIARLLGCQPTEAHRKGEVVGKGRPASIGLWALEAPLELPFDEKLAYLVKNTTSDKQAWDALATGHTIRLSCAIFLHSWTEGFVIPVDTVAEIGNRHWLFGMSVYSAEGDEVLDAFLKDVKKPEPGQSSP